MAKKFADHFADIRQQVEAMRQAAGHTPWIDYTWVHSQCDKILALIPTPSEHAHEETGLTFAKRQERMERDMHLYGCYRAEDVHAILGDPMKSVTLRIEPLSRSEEERIDASERERVEQELSSERSRQRMLFCEAEEVLVVESGAGFVGGGPAKIEDSRRVYFGPDRMGFGTD